MPHGHLNAPASNYRARRCGGALLVAGLGVLLPTLATAASLCRPSEQVLFACRPGLKNVAVCASADLSQTAGTLQYRFGKPTGVELSYPTDAGAWRPVTTGGTMTFAGGGGAYLSFANGAYRYIVYTGIGQGWGRKAGVVVEKNGKTVANLPCKDRETSELGPDLFSKAGIRDDARGFELP